MIWQLEWGEAADKIIAAAMESGGKIPPLPFIENKPQLGSHLAFEFSAFFDLSSERPGGFSIQSIPWSSIDRYATRYGIDDLDEFERFCRLVQAMDRAYIQHVTPTTPTT